MRYMIAFICIVTCISANDFIKPEDRKYWAYQPLKDPSKMKVPKSSWSSHPIDRFIARKLKEQKLSPAVDADKISLIRRVYFDLIGLPPSPQEIDDFVNSKDPKAYEQLLDRLLASPRYGERWGRHWLDLVRFAESDGYRADDFRPTAYKYRDYVIRSFNALKGKNKD